MLTHEDLDRARERVADAHRRLAEQQERLAILKADGHDISEAVAVYNRMKVIVVDLEKIYREMVRVFEAANEVAVLRDRSHGITENAALSAGQTEGNTPAPACQGPAARRCVAPDSRSSLVRRR
jgi:hypothetical protein